MSSNPISCEKDWEFVGYGSANAVFAYNGNSTNFKGKVVRLRLSGTDVSTTEVYTYLQSHAFDKLRNYMVDTILLDITKETISMFQYCVSNTGLSIVLDPKETHCLIMTNIFSHSITTYERIQLSKYHTFYINSTDSDIIFEFKPKWLYQLPASHKNCRNCLTAKSKNQDFILCHLKVISCDEGLFAWCKDLQEELSRKITITRNIDIQGQLRNCMVKNYEIIESLFELQNSIEIHDRLLQLRSEQDVNEDLQLNMTLRDVSLCMKLSKEKVFVIDLDKKTAKKWKKWKEQEEKLQLLYEQESDLNCRF